MSDAEIQGRKLAQQIYWSRPETNFTQTGVLKFHSSERKDTTIPLRFDLVVTATNWQTTYFAGSGVENAGGVLVVHTEGQPNYYLPNGGNPPDWPPKKLTAKELMVPFAPRSDFWICDLGLEFFHWPQQKILPKTINLKRGRAYTLLESTNPNPSTNGYSRVLSWIDQETGGILEAEAYDAQGKLLKVFEPDSFEKVNGQWQLQEMEIRNVQTGSRTRLTFDLKK